MSISDKQICDMAIEDVNKTISIKFPQYPEFGQTFKAHCINEAFEEIDILIDDVGEGFSESVILENVSEDIEIKDKDKEPLCSCIHYILTNFSPPPTSLNLVEIVTKVERVDVLSMEEIVTKQAILLKPAGIKDNALLTLFAIGRNNHFPLLTYLIDTYVRYRLLEYQKLYRQLNLISTEKKRKKFMEKKFNHVAKLSGFFKSCYAMKKIRIKSRDDVQSEKALLIYESNMNSFFRRFIGPLQMRPHAIIHKINDNILIYAKYYISILIAVNNLLQDATTKLPLQIDFWVLPKAMTNSNTVDEESDIEDDDDYKDDIDDDDIDDDDDNDDDEDEDERQKWEGLDRNDLEERLKYSDNLVIKPIECQEISKLSSTFLEVCKNVIKGEQSKRMVMIIDRRINGENVIENDKNYCKMTTNNDDKLYAFLPKNTQNIPVGYYLHEALFHLSRTEVLPDKDGKEPFDFDGNTIHATSYIMLNMCLLSIHIHKEDVVRAYWYFNSSFTRFFMQDMINIWPICFVGKEMNKGIYRQPIYQNIYEIIELVSNNAEKIPLQDTNFDTFFWENTRIAPSTTYQQLKMQKFSKLLIFGYIRSIYKDSHKIFPKDIINLCYKYYIQLFQTV